MRTMNVLLIVFLYLKCTACLIIPEEVPTILSLIYSNIPPIKKGTDSRFGVGFSLGEHADFQVILELGPQSETEPIGNPEESKRRRDIILNAAMNGDMGPWAQSIAEYQIQRKSGKVVPTLVNNNKNYENVKRIHNASKGKGPIRIKVIEEKEKLSKEPKKFNSGINVVNVPGAQPQSVSNSDPEIYINKLKTLYDSQKAQKDKV
ncbi:uncharacterized protein LOC122511038 [Leptopilina heterotoma]|uniref:uncharacterized protein LOC122511038 n=1 Tax=Leptopilina heterotoma TaxID=63436 RepID=UPI001CA8A317|nr:uncharacterized protein LOC122511038 [Leptopilina heterotoma]XP_043481977.1 uncharacterized protein LOC122511038 [Leptopilina heterotoma]XP_043481978.1 uncharacterized protein LOC122511038 [Leptopilina heterotoma]